MGSTFGAILSATSSTTLVMDVSADGEALTGTFADFQVEANNGPRSVGTDRGALGVVRTPGG